MKLRELLKKIELRFRPLQLGQGGQRVLDEADGLADDSLASGIENAPPAWPPSQQDEEVRP